MPEWRMAGEPSLDELLDDEIMDGVMRRAGIDAMELRRWLVEVAQRRQECGNSSSRRCGGAAFD